MPYKLPDFSGRTIENWNIQGKTVYNHHTAYHCQCSVCGYHKVITATDLNRNRNLTCGNCSTKWSSYANDNLTGAKIGSLAVGEVFRKNNRTYYHVKCDCGKEYDILRSNLIQKGYTHCKCRGNAVTPNKKYGMLMPLERLSNGKWKCRCDCGKIIEKDPGYLLREGMNLSCGCKKKADRVALRSDNKTGVKGVCWVARKGKYLAYITKDGYTYRLGFYDTVKQAALARKMKEIELFPKSTGTFHHLLPTLRYFEENQIDWIVKDYTDAALLNHIRNCGSRYGTLSGIRMELWWYEYGCFLHLEIQTSCGRTVNVEAYQLSNMYEAAEAVQFRKEAYRIKRLLTKEFPDIQVSSGFVWSELT